MQLVAPNRGKNPKSLFTSIYKPGDEFKKRTREGKSIATIDNLWGFYAAIDGILSRIETHFLHTSLHFYLRCICGAKFLSSNLFLIKP